MLLCICASIVRLFFWNAQLESLNNPVCRFSYSAVSTGAGKDDEEGDILLQSISVEDAEYGGSLDDVRTRFRTST